MNSVRGKSEFIVWILEGSLHILNRFDLNMFLILSAGRNVTIALNFLIVFLAKSN